MRILTDIQYLKLFFEYVLKSNSATIEKAIFAKNI